MDKKDGGTIDLESLRAVLSVLKYEAGTIPFDSRDYGPQREQDVADIEAAHRTVQLALAELTSRRARDAEAVRRQDMTTNDKLADALRNLIRAGKHLRNTVVETRGVAGMDDHDVAISDSIAALAEHDAQPAPEL